jgi:hypothetical protein
MIIGIRGGMKFFRLMSFFGLFACLILLVNCGSGGSNNGSSSNDGSNASGGANKFEMGGAIQGDPPLSLSGTVSTVAGIPASTDGTGVAASFNIPGHIATDGANLYVTDARNNTIRKIDISTGVVTTIAGNAFAYGSIDGIGMAARFNCPDGITTDGTSLYITDQHNNTIRKIVIATGAVTTIAGTPGNTGSLDGYGAVASFNHPRGITTDGTNLYVVDGGNSTIRKVVIATGAVSTLAGVAGIVGSADGTGAAARFNFPSGITTDGTKLYVADERNNTIRSIVIASGTVTTIAGTSGATGSVDGVGSAARFDYPAGLITDGTNLYVSEYNNSTIRKIEISTGTVTTIAGTAGTPGSSDGVGAVARFNGPYGITTDGINLYVADEGNNTIRKILISTGTVTTIAGTPGSTDGVGSEAKFLGPRDITTDGINLYITDQYNNTIRKMVISTSAVTTMAGTAGNTGSTDGTGTAAKFNLPSGITTDGTNIYVTDSLSNTIRKIVIATGAVTTIAGTPGNTGSIDGFGAAASFNYPRGITTDATNLYVVDGGNNTIRKVVIATGAVSTLAGTAGTTGSADGTGATARFNFPSGITTDGTNLYVADFFNNTIRKIVISTGAVSTLAGSASTAGSVDGAGTAATFDYPWGITTDGTYLYVTDYNSSTIRKIVISTGLVTTLTGTAYSYGSADGTGAAARFYGLEGITTDGVNLYVTDAFNNTIRKIN